jgi:hypothetical protein
VGSCIAVLLLGFCNRHSRVTMLPLFTSGKKKCFDNLWTQRMQVSTGLLPHDAIGVVAVIRQLTDKYPRCQQLLDNDPTPIGVFRYEWHDAPNPHACCPVCMYARARAQKKKNLTHPRVALLN